MLFIRELCPRGCRGATGHRVFDSLSSGSSRGCPQRGRPGARGRAYPEQQGLTALAVDGALGGSQVCPSGPRDRAKTKSLPSGIHGTGMQMEKMANESLKTALVGLEVRTVAILGAGERWTLKRPPGGLVAQVGSCFLRVLVKVVCWVCEQSSSCMFCTRAFSRMSVILQ